MASATASPFAQFSNATLTFTIGTGQTEMQGGNAVEITEEVVATVLLKPAKRGQKDKGAGVDSSRMRLEGYWVNPKSPPEGVSSDTPCRCHLENTIGSFQSGDFELEPVTQSPFLVALGIDIITRLSGVLLRENV